MDLVEVEVLQRQSQLGQHPRHGVGGRHQQAFASEVLSLGDQLPVAGLSANGRVKNRRVEAWIH